MKRSAHSYQDTFPSISVDVVEPHVRSKRGWVRCEIGKHLCFDTAGLEAYCLAAWEPVVYDAFVLAAAVEFCDRTKRRPATGWGRKITLRLPVHDPERWQASIVCDALRDALAFLTGDQWNISFSPRKLPAESPRQIQLSIPDGSRVIMPFSDGLDSLAVGGLMRQEFGRRLLRVRLGLKRFHGSPTGHDANPFTAVPYKVKAASKPFVESSARSRGFKFSLLTGLAAYLSEAEQIIVPESGQGALGPVLVPVGQAYEDYRNHPIFLKRMETFLLALLGHKVHYIFPRLWYTKGETLAEYAAMNPHGFRWRETVSCWQSQRHVSVSGKKRQCGICAACMLRRQSIHAMGAEENCDTYVWENLSTERFEDGAAEEFKKKSPSGSFYEYAIAGTLHLDHLADLRHTAQGARTLDRAAFQLGTVINESHQIIHGKLDRVLKQHEDEWKSFLHSLGPNSFVGQWALRVE